MRRLLKRYSSYRELRKYKVPFFDACKVALQKPVVYTTKTGDKGIISNWRDARMLNKAEPKLSEWISAIGARDSGQVFYDIGANIGQFTILASRAGLRVYAFEPHFENFRTLAQNIFINKSAAMPLCCFVSKDSGIQTFDIGVKHSGSCVFDNRTTERNTVQVLSVSLNDLHRYFKIPRPAYIKIDTDGNSEHIIESADLSSIREIVIEANDKQHEKVIADILTARGFVLYDKECLIEKKKFPANEFWRRKH